MRFEQNCSCADRERLQLLEVAGLHKVTVSQLQRFVDWKEDHVRLAVKCIVKSSSSQDKIGISDTLRRLISPSEPKDS